MSDIETHSSIFVAGHRGMVGSAIWRCLESKGYTNLIGRTHPELEGRMALERKQRTHRYLRHYVQKRKEKGQTMNSNPSALLSPTPSAFSFHPSSLSLAVVLFANKKTHHLKPNKYSGASWKH